MTSLQQIVDDAITAARAPEHAELAFSVAEHYGAIEVRVESPEWLCLGCGVMRSETGEVFNIDDDDERRRCDMVGSFEHVCSRCDDLVDAPTARAEVVASSVEMDGLADDDEDVIEAVTERVVDMIDGVLADDRKRMAALRTRIESMLADRLADATLEDAQGVDAPEPWTATIDSVSGRMSMHVAHPRTGEIIEVLR